MTATPMPPAAEPGEYKFAITPLLGYRTGGDFENDDSGAELSLDDAAAVGFILNAPAEAIGNDAYTEWELYFSRQSAGIDDDFTFRCKFDGISHKVDQDLSQASRVPHHSVRCHRRDTIGQFKALGMRLGGNGGQGVAYAVTEAEVGIDELKLAGLHFREVEEGID